MPKNTTKNGPYIIINRFINLVGTCEEFCDCIYTEGKSLDNCLEADKEAKRMNP